MSDVLKQIEELSEKAVKYDNLKGRYMSVAQKLRDAANKIEEAIGELDPASTVKTRTRSGGKELNEKLAEQYKKMEMGLIVTMKSLQKDYPNAEDDTLKYLFYQKLNKAPKVMKRKDDGTTVLYIQKNM